MMVSTHWWTLAQAVAWIVTRDPDDLNAISSEDLEARAAWQRCSGVALPDLSSGKRQLLDALATGRIVADGLEPSTNLRRPVPVAEYRRVEIVDRDRHVFVEGCAWTNLIVPDDTVRALWPPAYQVRFTASEAATYLAFGHPRSAAWLRTKALEQARRWDHKAASLAQLEAWLEQASLRGLESLDDDVAAFIRARWAAIDADSGIAKSLAELLATVRADLADQRALARADVELVEACRIGRLTGEGHRRKDSQNGGSLSLPMEISRTAWVAGIGLRYDNMEPTAGASTKEVIDAGRMEGELFVNVTFSSEAIRSLLAPIASADLPSAPGAEPQQAAPMPPIPGELLHKIVAELHEFARTSGMWQPNAHEIRRSGPLVAAQRGYQASQKQFEDAATGAHHPRGKSGRRRSRNLRAFSLEEFLKAGRED